MYRIRFHGRGGQGIKTASRILGSALFKEGFEVQDAPRYGAERRGAPIFAYVRADRRPINERGEIREPDLVVVSDDSLFAVPTAGVLLGVDRRTVLLLNSRETPDTWRHRLGLDSVVHCLPDYGNPADAGSAGLIGSASVGAAARLLGVIAWRSLSEAIDDELGFLDDAAVEANHAAARSGFDSVPDFSGSVLPGGDAPHGVGQSPGWIDVPFETARVSAPAIHGALTSVAAKTGLWRTMRPVIEEQHCNRCWWICSTFCPDGAIEVGDDNAPRIDYDHCKGCLVCVAVCPHHAISAVPEHSFHEQAKGDAE